MRDRERFEVRAIECGATIIRSERTVLTVEANNGKMTTTYTFTEDGTFKNISTIWAWQKPKLLIIYNYREQEEVIRMTKATFKKTARTTFCGQCKVGGTWVERVRTPRQANKAERRACKVALSVYR